MKDAPNLFRGLGHALAALTTECSEFHRVWETPSGTHAHDGRWEGEWRSETNGHHGKLRAVLRVISPREYQAHFHATYARLLRVCYGSTLKASGENGGLRLEGEHDLGELAGGVYTYRGRFEEGRLIVHYSCRYDEGTFTLAKVP